MLQVAPKGWAAVPILQERITGFSLKEKPFSKDISRS